MLIPVNTNTITFIKRKVSDYETKTFRILSKTLKDL